MRLQAGDAAAGERFCRQEMMLQAKDDAAGRRCRRQGMLLQAEVLTDTSVSSSPAFPGACEPGSP